MVATAELLAFGIQSALKLLRTGRRIYAEQTLSRQIVVPLPQGLQSPLASARLYAIDLRTQDRKRFREVFKAVLEASVEDATREAAERELVDLYLLDLGRGLVPGFRTNAVEVAGIAALQQWAADKSPLPHPLQRVAGALVEIAVDYFLDVPGSLDEESREGKAVRAFLEGLDDLEFQEARWDAIVVALFTAGLDTLHAEPALVTGNEDRQSLVRNAVKGVADDLKARLEALPAAGDPDAENRIRLLAPTLLRSLLRNSGLALADHPQVLGIDDLAQQGFFKEVFSTFMDLLTEDDEASLGQALRRVLSSEGLDRIVLSVVKAGSEFPEFFGIGEPEVRDWLQGILEDLYEAHEDGRTFFDHDLFVEIASLVFEHGLQDLPLLLKVTPTKRALLVEVALVVNDLLELENGDGWKFDLSRTDVKGIFEQVLRTVATHPNWIDDRPRMDRELPELVHLGLKFAAQAGGGRLKRLVRTGNLARLLATLLGSGVLGKLNAWEEDDAGVAVKEVLKVIEAQGLAGVEDLLGSGLLHDMLVAVVRSGAVDKLIEADDAMRAALIAKITELFNELRAGPPQPVAAMTARLKAVA